VNDQVIIGHFGDESLQSVTCTYWQTRKTKRHVKNTNQWNPQNGPNEQQYKTLKKPRLRERTDRAWFSRLLRHPIRKLSGSLLSYNLGARTGQLNTVTYTIY